MGLANLIGVLFLASVHLWSSQLRFLDAKPRSPWLSLAGGASLAWPMCLSGSFPSWPKNNQQYGVEINNGNSSSPK